MGIDHLVEDGEQDAAQTRSHHQGVEAREGLAVLRGGGFVFEGGHGGGHQLHREGGDERPRPEGRQD
jgi:hypothetical protein